MLVYENHCINLKMNKNRLALIAFLLPFLGGSNIHAENNRNVGQINITAIQKCSACHGIDGNSSNPQWPSIAGLNEKYILKQLKDFKSGTRTNPEMELTVKSLDSDNESIALALYFSQQEIKPINDSFKRSSTASKLVNLKLGKELFIGERIDYGIPACTACHGNQGGGRC